MVKEFLNSIRNLEKLQEEHTRWLTLVNMARFCATL